MNTNLVKIFAFFIGLFITLIIISFVRVNEPFTNMSVPSLSSLSISPIATLSALSSPIAQLAGLTEITTNIADDIKNYIDYKNDDSILPYNGYKFMCINTYNNLDNIVINDGRWYDIDSSLNYLGFNYNNYFTFSKIINLVNNKLNNKIGIKGADISSVELLGPPCFNFANNSETYELTEFTMFMTIKFISCSNANNILFEMTGNTTTINYLEPEYKTSIIHINIILNENKNYKIKIIIGDTIYEKEETNNIDKDIIENSNYFIIGLYYTNEKIGLIFNDKLYEYENKNTFKITLGSTPIIINKNKSLNIHLYNFVYYKSLFNFNEYEYLIRYNNYYISGLYAKECPKIEEPEIKKDTQLKPIEDIQKIILPEFNYPILQKNNNETKLDFNNNNDNNNFRIKIIDFINSYTDNDNEFKNNLNIYLNEDNSNNILKTKIINFINSDNNINNNDFKINLLNLINNDDYEEDKPNIFKRIFGF
jgi:hypothetical protein